MSDAGSGLVSFELDNHCTAHNPATTSLRPKRTSTYTKLFCSISSQPLHTCPTIPNSPNHSRLSQNAHQPTLQPNKADQRLARPSQESQEALRNRLLQEQSPRMALRHRDRSRQCPSDSQRLLERLQGPDCSLGRSGKSFRQDLDG